MMPCETPAFVIYHNFAINHIPLLWHPFEKTRPRNIRSLPVLLEVTKPYRRIRMHS